MRGEDFAALCADLEAALRELTSAVDRDPSLWTRGRPGKWTAGQQVAHVGLILTRMAEAFEAAEPALRAGTLPAVPRRGLLQAMFVKVVVENGFMPSGARAAAFSLPPDRPERSATLAALKGDAGRLRAVGERLSAAERDRLWIRSPGFVTTWHYRLPEAVRIHAVHARHHARAIAGIPARGSGRAMTNRRRASTFSSRVMGRSSVWVLAGQPDRECPLTLVSSCATPEGQVSTPTPNRTLSSRRLCRIRRSYLDDTGSCAGGLTIRSSTPPGGR